MDAEIDRRLELNAARRRARVVAMVEMAVPPLKFFTVVCFLIIYGFKDLDVVLECLGVFLMFLAATELCMAILLFKASDDEVVAASPENCKKRVLIWMIFKVTAVVIYISVLIYLMQGRHMDFQFWLAAIILKDVLFVFLASSFWSELKWVVTINKINAMLEPGKIDTLPPETIGAGSLHSGSTTDTDHKSGTQSSSNKPPPRASTETTASSNSSMRSPNNMREKPKARARPKPGVIRGSANSGNKSEESPKKHYKLRQ